MFDDNNTKFTIIEGEDEIKITKCYEPPPPYSETNPSLPTCSQQQPSTPNYGATSY
jgi:hypothetical protein